MYSVRYFVIRVADETYPVGNDDSLKGIVGCRCRVALIDITGGVDKDVARISNRYDELAVTDALTRRFERTCKGQHILETLRVLVRWRIE